MQMKKIDNRCFGECMGKIICCIYMIMRISTGQKYIGQTIDFYRRYNDHKYGRDYKQLFIDKEIREYGWDDFIMCILEVFPTVDYLLLNNAEKFWIAYYDTEKNDFHYNEHPGGGGYPSKSKLDEYKSDIISLYLKGESGPQIAEKYGCDSSSIYDLLAKNNIDRRSKSDASKSIIWKYQEDVCQMYLNGYSMQEIAEHYNCGMTVVFNILEDNNIDRRHNIHNVWNYQNEVCEMYLEGKEPKNIALLFNCSNKTIRKIIKSNGYKIKVKRGKTGLKKNDTKFLEIRNQKKRGKSCYRYFLNGVEQFTSVDFDKVVQRAKKENLPLTLRDDFKED